MIANLLVSFLSTFIICLLVVRYGHLHNHLTADDDLEGVQKFHETPVPRIGGGGILVGIICGEVAKLFLEPKFTGFGFLVIIAAIPAFAVGLIEDLTKCVSPSRRLFATAFSAAVGGILLGGWLTHLDIPGIDHLMTFRMISILVTCFAIAGVANSFNLIDGYNGLSGMVAVISLGGLAYVANQVGDSSIFATACIVATSILGFLVWNYPRGVIFLGDGGAYLIGFLVAELSVLLVVRNSQISPWFPLVVVFYPIFETIFTIFRRAFITKTHLGLPDAAHLHQLIYLRVVCWAMNNNYIRKKMQYNAMTSPYLWVMSLSTVIPAVLFWSDTAVLQLITLIFSCFYILVYGVIYKSRFTNGLDIRSK